MSRRAVSRGLQGSPSAATVMLVLLYGRATREDTPLLGCLLSPWEQEAWCVQMSWSRLWEWET